MASKAEKNRNGAQISTKTVEFHRGALLNTLGLHSAAELTRCALAHGIVQ